MAETRSGDYSCKETFLGNKVKGILGENSCLRNAKKPGQIQDRWGDNYPIT